MGPKLFGEVIAAQLADGDCGSYAHVEALAAGALAWHGGDVQALRDVIGNFGADALSFVAEDDESSILRQVCTVNVVAIEESAQNGHVVEVVKEKVEVGVVNLHAAYGSHGCLHHFVIVDVDSRFAGEYITDAIPVGKAHYSAQVARVLDVIEHDVEPVAHLVVAIINLWDFIHRHHVAGRGELRHARHLALVCHH